MSRTRLAIVLLLLFPAAVVAGEAEYVSHYDPVFVASVSPPLRFLRLPLVDIVCAGGVVGGCGGAAGASLAGTNTWTGTQTFSDTGFLVVDDGDATKKIAFQASSIGAGTTRTFTFPNVNATVFTGSASNDLLSGGNIRASADATGLALGAVDGASNRVSFSTIQTPDSGLLSTGTTSNAWIIGETQDNTFDYAHAAQTNPTLFIHSAAQSTTQWMGLTHDGTNALLTAGTGNFEVTPSTRLANGNVYANGSNSDLQLGLNTSLAWQNSASANAGAAADSIGSGKAKDLTESSATNVVSVPVASGGFNGGKIVYTVVASDATDHQSRSGEVHFSQVNKAGTETCAVYGIDGSFTVNPIQTQDGSGAGAFSSGTLTYAWAVDTSGANTCMYTLNAVSSLTQSTFQIYYMVVLNGLGGPPVLQ